MIPKSIPNKEKAKLRRELAEMRDNIAYMQERVRLSSEAEAKVVEKNLTYAKKKEDELCKRLTETTS